MEKITAALVTYNRKELLHEALEALMAQSFPVEILVIDNASTDGTEKMLEKWIKQGKIHYRNTGKNLGGAGGFCLALEEALKLGSEYIWMMDDDTIVKEDSLEKLLEQARLHPQAAFFSSKAIWIDGTQNRMNQQRLLKKDIGQKAIPCREATFVSLLVKSDAIYKYGLPVKEFFIWGDDIEYTRRLSFRSGGYYVPDSVVLHKTANNEGTNIVTDHENRLPRYRYAYRNEVYIAKQEGTGRKVRQLAKILYHTGKVLMLSKDKKMEKIRLIWSASWEGLSFHANIRYPENKQAESEAHQSKH